MGRRLAKTVVVRAPDGTGSKVFRPGDDLPDWAAALITNPKAWATEVLLDTSVAPPSGAPPTSGKGSGRDAWVQYAESLGVEITDEMSRTDIMDAVQH